MIKKITILLMSLFLTSSFAMEDRVQVQNAVRPLMSQVSDFVSQHKLIVSTTAAAVVAIGIGGVYMFSGPSLPSVGAILRIPQHCFTSMDLSSPPDTGISYYGPSNLSACVSDFIATKFDPYFISKIDVADKFFKDLTPRHDITSDLMNYFGNLNQITHLIKRGSSFNPLFFQGSVWPLGGNIPDTLYAAAQCRGTLSGYPVCKLLSGFIFGPWN